MRRVHYALGVSLAAARDVRFGMRAQAAAAAAHNTLLMPGMFTSSSTARARQERHEAGAGEEEEAPCRGRGGEQAMIHLRRRSR